MLLVVGAGESDGLRLDLGVEPLEFSVVVLDGERVGGDLGCVLVAYYAQPDGVPAWMRVASSAMAAVRASIIVFVVFVAVGCVCVCVA